MRYDSIIFDFDGTLADTRDGIVRTVQGTLERMGLPEADPAAVVKTIGLPLSECFRTATSTPAERVEEAVELYRAIFNDLALDHITIFPEVLDTLEALEAQGVTLAIASSRHHFSLDPLVEQLGVGRFIRHVYGEDEALQPKPAPDMTLKILHDLHLDPSRSLVVGDTIYDLLMGLRAGCRTCGVTYGNQDRAQLSSVRPDFIIDRMSELLAQA